jgi:hypothetical protein
MQQFKKKEKPIQKKAKTARNGEVSKLVSTTPLMLKKLDENQKAFAETITQRKSGVKRKVNKNSITETIFVEVSKKVPSRYVEVEFKGAYNVAVQFSKLERQNSKEDISVEMNPVNDVSIEGSFELYKAKELGKAKVKKLIDTGIERGGFRVEKIEILSQYENKKDGKEDSVATGVKLIFHNQQEMVVKLNLVQLAKGEISVLGLNEEQTIPFPNVKLWEGDGYSLVGKGEIKLSGDVTPRWSSIMQEIGKQGLLKGGGNILKSFISGITVEGLIASGFLMGGAVTLFSAGMAIKDIDDIERCSKNAVKALNDFSTAYCSSFGIPPTSADKSSFMFRTGKNMGVSNLSGIIRMIQSNPIFSAYNFTREELEPNIIARIQEQAPILYTAVHNRYRNSLYELYILAFYNKKKKESWGLMESKEAYAYREAKYVAYRLDISPSFLHKKDK